MASWHKLRKRIHLLCFLVFLALPFLNVVRFDIPQQRFYFAGYELWINEFAIIFFAMMFLMFLVVASSVFYGRVYCGYLCPQMIFSEASVASRDLAAPTRHQAVPPLEAGRARTRPRAPCSTPSLAAASASCWPSSSSPISWSRAISGAACSRSTSTPPAASPARPSRWSPSSISPWCASASAPPSAPTAICRACWATSNTLLVHYRDENHAVHRMQEVRARLPHGDRHSRVALPDRVRTLRRVHRRLRGNPGAPQKARL